MIRNQRYLHWYDEMYKRIHIPAYTNFGSFLCGMIGGILFDKYKQEQVELGKLKVCFVFFDVGRQQMINNIEIRF